jgi:hypothetical protein
MSDFQINGETYQARKLSAMDQFHLGRKLAHVLSFLAAQDDKTKLAEAFPRAFTALSGHISKEDMDEVTRTCWGAVSRRQPSGWAPVAPNGVLMFADIDDLKSMLTVMWNVLQTNGLIDFFAESPSASGAGTTGAIG